MIIDVASLILVGISLAIFLWSFYNVPILIAGVRNLCRGRQKPQKSSPSNEFLPTFLIVAISEFLAHNIYKLTKLLSWTSFGIGSTKSYCGA